MAGRIYRAHAQGAEGSTRGPDAFQGLVIHHQPNRDVLFQWPHSNAGVTYEEVQICVGGQC